MKNRFYITLFIFVIIIVVVVVIIIITTTTIVVIIEGKHTAYVIPTTNNSTIDTK